MRSSSDFDPHHPMRSWIAALDDVKLDDDADNAEIAATLPPPFRPMYHEFRRLPVHGQKGHGFNTFLRCIKGLDTAVPSGDDLKMAPELCRWSLLRRPASSICHLIGYAISHPRFDWGTPVVTSTVFRIDPRHRWARTWGRFYLLTEYAPETLSKMQADGMIKRDVELVQIK